MQLLRSNGLGFVATGLFAATLFLSFSAATGAPIAAFTAHTDGVQALIASDLALNVPGKPVPVTDLPPEPGSRYYSRRPSFRDYTFKGRRFGGSRYKGPPTPFYQTYSNDQTANGFDYGGRCTRVSIMCARDAENTRAGYNSCMQAYGCRED